MKRKKLLSELEKQERSLKDLERWADVERAHIDADDILANTVMLLAEANFGYVTPEIEALLNAYWRVSKWYA